jgi:hypothetical protein
VQKERVWAQLQKPQRQLGPGRRWGGIERKLIGEHSKGKEILMKLT